MAKITKKLTLILLAVLCLSLCFGVLVACNDPADDSVTYSVTLKIDENTPVPGIAVTVKKGTTKIGNPVTTDVNGKATFKLAEDDYTAELKLPGYFELTEGANLELKKDARDITVMLKEGFSYKVEFVNLDDNKPFYAENVSVIMCTINPNGSENCLNPVKIGLDGIARILPPNPSDSDVFHVKVEGLPEEYELYMEESNFTNGYYNKTLTKSDSPNTSSVTIYVQHVKDITTNVVEVKETLSQFAEQEGELTGVPMDGSAQLVYNETDKFYHFGAADGPVVVVNLTGINDPDRFAEEVGIVYIEMTTNSNIEPITNVTPEGSPSYVEVLDDYRTMLRGFEEYDLTPNMTGGFVYSIPKNITTETYYAKYVNSDGVYPLTKELETFLKGFCKTYNDFIDRNGPIGAAEGSAWLFPCYYYDKNANPSKPSEGDVIIGEYKLVSFSELVQWQDENWVFHEELKTFAVGDEYSDGSTVTDDMYTLRINADGSFVMVAPSPMGEQSRYSGNWASDGNGNYTASNCVDDWGDAATATISYNATTKQVSITFVSFDIEYPFVFVKA